MHARALSAGLRQHQAGRRIAAGRAPRGLIYGRDVNMAVTLVVNTASLAWYKDAADDVSWLLRPDEGLEAEWENFLQ